MLPLQQNWMGSSIIRTIDYWLYGHHHFNTPQFAIGKTKFITNQLGYVKYREQKRFRNDAIIVFG